jgi:hypothetical protein
MKRLLICSTVIASLICANTYQANAIFGLSTCEKVKKQAVSDSKVIKSLADKQAALVKTRDSQIKKETYSTWLSDPNAVSEEEVKNRTLATYKKILSSFQNLQKNQKCLKPDKYADVLSLIEAYKRVVSLWSGLNAPYLSSDPIKYGELTYYLK